MLQLLYTSAPRLLEAGKTGFGTLARSKDMPQPLVSFLERISAFDRQAGVAALQCYTIHRMGKVLFHVFSRIGDCGADYTGRTNHLAHHYVIEEGTPEGRAVMSTASPAAFMMSLSALWKTSYQEAPGYVSDVPAPSPRGGASSVWSEFTGRPDAAQWILAPQYKDGCCLLIDSIATEAACLQLLNEALNLLPGAGWGRGFATACVNNLSVTLTPFVCLDARQTASGILPHRGYPTLNVNRRLGAPPKIAPTMATMPPSAPSPQMPMPSPPPPPIDAQMPAMPTVMPEALPSYSRRNNVQKPPSANPLLMKLGIIGALALGGIVMYNVTSSSADKEENTPPASEKRSETPPPPAQKETPPADKQDPATPTETPKSNDAEKPEPPAPAKDASPASQPVAISQEKTTETNEQPAEPAAQSDKPNNGVKNTPQPSRTATAKTRQVQTVEQPPEHVNEPQDESAEDDRNPQSASNDIQEDSLTFGQIIKLPKEVCKIKVKASLGHDLSTSVKITATVDIKDLISHTPALADKVYLIRNDGDKEWRDSYNFTSKQIQQEADPSVKAAKKELNAADESHQKAKKNLEAAVKAIADATKKPNKRNAQAEKNKPVQQPATAKNDDTASKATEELKTLLSALSDTEFVKGLKGKIDTLDVDNDLIRNLKEAKDACTEAQNVLKNAESALKKTKDQYITSLKKYYEENTQLLLTIDSIDGNFVNMKYKFKHKHE